MRSSTLRKGKTRQIITWNNDVDLNPLNTEIDDGNPLRNCLKINNCICVETMRSHNDSKMSNLQKIKFQVKKHAHLIAGFLWRQRQNAKIISGKKAAELASHFKSPISFLLKLRMHKIQAGYIRCDNKQLSSVNTVKTHVKEQKSLTSTFSSHLWNV